MVLLINRSANFVRIFGKQKKIFSSVYENNARRANILCGSVLYMMSARNTVRSLFDYTDSLEEVFRKTNNILCDTSDKEFITMFLICVDISSGEGEYINAGHNPPVIVHSDGEADKVESKPQLIMGMFPNVEYKSEKINLCRGDVLCLYTDGIPDAMDCAENTYGTERIASVVKASQNSTAEEIRNDVLSDVSSFADETKFIDDRTVVVLKWN